MKNGFILSPSSMKYEHQNQIEVESCRRESAEVTIITAQTLVINSYSSQVKVNPMNCSHSNKENNDNDNNNNKMSTTSCTSLVDFMTRKIAYPSTIYPSKLLLRGLLLMGPPGVGKTYSVKVLQQHVQSWCIVKITEVKVTDLLCSDNAVETLTEMLRGAYYKKPPDAIDTIGGSVGGSMTASSPLKKRFEWTPVSSPSSSSIAQSQLYTPPSTVAEKISSPSSSSRSSRFNAKAENKSILSIVVIDEIDALGKSETSTELQGSLRSLLCKWFDRSTQVAEVDLFYPIVVVATSNRPSDVDDCFRRGGRFEYEIDIMGNSATDKMKILRSLIEVSAIYERLIKFLSLQQNKDEEYLTRFIDKVVESIVSECGGYVAADLATLTTEATVLINEKWESWSIEGNKVRTNEDLMELIRSTFVEATRKVPPSSLRGMSTKIPDLSYDDVIGNEEAKQSLKRLLNFCRPSMRDKLNAFGISTMGGILLHGPPGNSKTRLIMAAVSTHNLPIISLSSADVYSVYVGDAEAAIRRAFRVARLSSPCVLFMDELDAIVTNRGHSSSSSGSNVEARVMATLLTEMDGIDGNDNGVVVIGATNRIDCIDAALIRKGRFHHVLYIKPPDEDERKKLLQYFSKQFSLPKEVYSDISMRLVDNMSGADIENLCREESMKIIRAKVIEQTRRASEKL